MKMKIGTNVRMVNCAEAEIHKDRIWTTRSDPWQIGCGEWLVLLEGYRGGFSVKCLEEVRKDIVAVKFPSKEKKGEYAGREYTYYAAIPVKVGDIILAPMKNSETKAQVVRVNIQDSEINFDKSLIKTIKAAVEQGD